MTFNDFQLSAGIVAALKEKGYKSPTPIQAEAIPIILEGRDLLGMAQTGTGKTAAFCIPLLQRLVNSRGRGGIRALVLVPTRELAVQVFDNLKLYGKHLPIRSLVIYGGVSQFHQEKEIKRGADILVATPGRMHDLIAQQVLSLKNLEVLILDEADRMLDMGFIHDIRKLLKIIPASRQNLFFSATMPADVQELASRMLRNPVKVAVESKESRPRISQSVYYVSRESKRSLLKHVITEKDMQNVLVFARTKYGADKIAKDLNKAGISAEAIHGNKSQNARQRALTNFKQNATRVLVATDIAARGIDIVDLPFVINYELPQSPETYTHRIGRTGRAGQAGFALSFCDEAERGQLKDISRIINSRLVVADHPFS